MSLRPFPVRAFIFAVTCTLLAGLVAASTPSLPGDVALARALQALSPGTGWVPVFVSTASAPAKFILMALAVLGTWRLAGTRAAAVVFATIVLEQLFGEASKSLAVRPRPSRELVAVMGHPTGFSFPVDDARPW